MILTAQLRWLRSERRITNGDIQVIPTTTLQQWYDPDPTRGELVGEWQDVPIVEGDPVVLSRT